MYEYMYSEIVHSVLCCICMAVFPNLNKHKPVQLLN